MRTLFTLLALIVPVIAMAQIPPLTPVVPIVPVVDPINFEIANADCAGLQDLLRNREENGFYLESQLNLVMPALGVTNIDPEWYAMELAINENTLAIMAIQSLAADQGCILTYMDECEIFNLTVDIYNGYIAEAEAEVDELVDQRLEIIIDGGDTTDIDAEIKKMRDAALDFHNAWILYVDGHPCQVLPDPLP